MDEEFFIGKINKGLSPKKLTNKEVEVLKMSVYVVFEEGYIAPDVAQELNDKCVDALTVAYNKDMEMNKDLALIWRDKISQVYGQSEAVVSAIIQDWYLKFGRSLEKAAVKPSCLPLVGFFLVSVLFNYY